MIAERRGLSRQAPPPHLIRRRGEHHPHARRL